MKFSFKKMFRKAAKVSSTTMVGTGGMMGLVGGNPTDGFWAGLVTAVITCAANYANFHLKKKFG